VVDRVTALVRAGLRFGCAVTAVPALPEGAGTIVDRRDWS